MKTLSRSAEASPDPDAIGNEVRAVLHAFIARRVGDPHVADDLTQDVLLKAHRAGSGLEEIDDVAAWLYRIARNRIIDHFRARDRRPAPEVLHDLDVGETGEGDDEAVRALAACLRPLVDRLEPAHREALTLTDLDGLTQTEAARRAGISTSGMKSRVQRARAQLRIALLDCCAVHTDAGGHISDYTPRECECCGPDITTSQESST